MRTMKPLPPLARLHERLRVSNDGVLFWRDGPHAGQQAGAPKDKQRPYMTFRLDGAALYVHRVVFAMTRGYDPHPWLVDHEDEDKANNRPSNLQLLTNRQNLKKAHLTQAWNTKGNK